MDTEVLVVGAGPTGLFLASDLARFGIAVTIIDRGDGPSIHSKALGIHARTLETFATRQFADRFVERGLPIQKARLYSGGTERAQLPFDEIDSAYPFILSLPQSDTEQLLLEQLHSCGGDVRWQTELNGLSLDDEGVTAHITDPENSYHLRTRWVIGCDGAHSRVRNEAGIGWSGEDINAPFALMDARIDSDVLDAETFQVFLLDDSRLILFIPLPDGRQRAILTLSQPLSEFEVDRAFFQTQLTEHVDKSLTLRDLDWISTFSVRQRVADSFRRGRICLAGDAAHAHSPVGAQGMNTGLQDAHNLAWKLAARLRDTAPETLMDSYDAERRPIAERVVQMTGLGTRFAGQMPGWMRFLRNSILTLLPKISALRSRLLAALSQVRINYQQSPLTHNELGRQEGSLRAGHFAPNLTGTSGADLYSTLTKGRPVALVASTVSPPSLLADLEMPVLAVPPSTLEVHGTPSRALLIVRPDGYIGYAGFVENVAPLRTYLTQRLLRSPSSD